MRMGIIAPCSWGAQSLQPKARCLKASRRRALSWQLRDVDANSHSFGRWSASAAADDPIGSPSANDASRRVLLWPRAYPRAEERGERSAFGVSVRGTFWIQVGINFDL
jgi:hypothetical protein